MQFPRGPDVQRRSPTPSTRRRVTALAVATAACTVGAVLFAGGPADAATRQVLPDSVPTWATASDDAGTVAASTDVEGEVYLPLKNQAGAEALATAVSTPGSPQYRKPLSPAAWIAAYAPTKADVDQVTGFLRAQGLSITAVPASHEYVVFRGAASVVDSVLGTTLHSYRHAQQTLVAPSTAPSLPASIAGLVSGVSVDQGRLLTHPELVEQGQTPATSTPTRSLRQQATAPTGINAKCSAYAGEHTATVPSAYGKTVRADLRLRLRAVADPLGVRRRRARRSRACRARGRPSRSSTRTPRRRSSTTRTATRSSTGSPA